MTMTSAYLLVKSGIKVLRELDQLCFAADPAPEAMLILEEKLFLSRWAMIFEFMMCSRWAMTFEFMMCSRTLQHTCTQVRDIGR